ncbi:MAG: HupE/UreJ family protein [Gallionella sp.]|nr:HupE/UreJ family protein [Gallionella sp.]
MQSASVWVKLLDLNDHSGTDMTISLHARLMLKILLSLLVLAPNLAQAHAGIGEAVGWVHGMLHPFTGLDHLCAMIAVGLWARQMGGLWLAPLTFIFVMALGGLLGMKAIPLPFVEGGILASMLVPGVLIAAAIRPPLSVSLTLVGFFALFHGYAHGAEMPYSASGFTYMSGFMLSTAALHLTGVGMATLLAKTGRVQWFRLAGASIALFGGALFFVG